MASEREFRVLVATDGSAQAKTAVATTVRFPWPVRTQVRAVVARRTRAPHRRSILLAALDYSASAAAEGARRALSRRWPDAAVAVVDKAPVAAVLGEAERLKAHVIVLGWRGQGAVRRLVLGSVSRGVVRGARCAVLVVRRRSPDVRNVIVGIDGSVHSQHAVALLARLVPPRRGAVTLFRAVETMTAPALTLASPDTHEAVAREVRRINAERVAKAGKELQRHGAVLKRRGWRVRTMIGTGDPLHDLLATADTVQAHLLVVGARGTGGLRHLLLGSVAEGALNRCPAPVLVVR
jgi:nucleotide-binding universal stress UspA family protein